MLHKTATIKYFATGIRFTKYSRAHSTWTTCSYNDLGVRFPRLLELRNRLTNEKPALKDFHVFDVSKTGTDFLDWIKDNNLNKKYSRGGKNGEGYVGVAELVEAGGSYYDDEKKLALLEKSSQIQNRMRAKASHSYLNHLFKIPSNALTLNPALKIIMPDTQEIENLDGETDPSNQNRFSPLPGLLHKYEMLLAMVSINCSSHCRYCYRLDLFNGSSNKSKTDMPLIATYVKTFNHLIDEEIKNNGKFDVETGLWLHKITNEPLIHAREILFSGGDPMTLPNATLARYMVLMAEAGITTIRLGTKELAFNPSRFDRDFWRVMDRFHEIYPYVRLDIVGHYSHPYELVEAKTDVSGRYIYDINQHYHIREDIRAPLAAINSRIEWVGHHNQFPIIAQVNDSPEVLRLLIYLSHRLGIAMHNIYACREIAGNKHFRSDNTIESQFKLLEKAKIGLSGLKNHGRLMMSTEFGKLEILGIDDDSNVLLSINRFIHGNKPENLFIKVALKKLPEGKKFYWLTDEVIDCAVLEDGREVLSQLRVTGGSVIESIKKKTASFVLKGTHAPDMYVSGVDSSCHQRVLIEVKKGSGVSKLIRLDLAQEIHRKKPPTLARVLADEKEIEAACDEQLSCSTCVGSVSSTNSLPSMSDDEADLVDSCNFKRNTGTAGAVIDANINDPSSLAQVRAGCQIKLSPGKYKFTSDL